MTDNRQIAAELFAAWSAGTAYVTSILAPDVRWEIVGRSAAAGVYEGAQVFVDEVLTPFGSRFAAETPFQPVFVRGIYADDSQDTVVVLWDGEGTTTIGTLYWNTYAWVLRFRDGLVVAATAFYDSIAFDELWESVDPSRPDPA